MVEGELTRRLPLDLSILTSAVKILIRVKSLTISLSTFGGADFRLSFFSSPLDGNASRIGSSELIPPLRVFFGGDLWFFFWRNGDLSFIWLISWLVWFTKSDTPDRFRFGRKLGRWNWWFSDIDRNKARAKKFCLFVEKSSKINNQQAIFKMDQQK